MFGDFTTVNPCSLTDPSVFENFGSTDFGTPESTLDYCTIIVKPATGTQATVNVGLFGTLAAAPELESQRVRRDVERGLWVGQHSADPAKCTQLLVFPDSVTMEVRAYEAAGDVDTCPIAEAAMNHAIEVVLNRDVSHRSPAGNSLVLIDPCSLVDAEDLAAVPGLSGVREPADYPGKHSCYWDAGDAAGMVVAFGAGPKLRNATESVAGRPTVAAPVEVEARSYCNVETAHIPFTEVNGVDDYFELATVFVRLPPGQATAACTAARTIAEAVWPKLPRT